MLRRMKKTSRIVFGLFLLLSSLLLTGASPARQPEVRAIWVTRFDFKTPADVEAIVANCARTGFTDIFFQIRGNGTVFYPSQVEPWAFELSGSDVAFVAKASTVGIVACLPDDLYVFRILPGGISGSGSMIQRALLIILSVRPSWVLLWLI